MENAKFIKQIEDTFKDAVKLVRVKNQDYANSVDPYKNFRASVIVNVDPRRAILVRVADKLSRISNLLDKKSAVKDEPIFNDLVDSINYLCILKVWLENGE